MLQVLNHPVFRRLFVAQVVALLGTGLLTIALGLLAFQIAGGEAGRVLGLALTIKMVAYVVLSPVMTALVVRLDRRHVLIAADVVRAGAALMFPFISEAWHIYVLIFVLQAASATFTPTFQAALPDVLPKEDEYTRALSLSRLAYDLENLLSPVLAGILLVFLAPSALFAGTVLGFAVSALLIQRTRLPRSKGAQERSFRERVTRGSRIYLATPRLRGLLALNATVSAVGAVVIVQSVVISQQIYAGSKADLAVLLGAYGLGSMAVALGLPRVLDRVTDRAVMLPAALCLATIMTLSGVAILATGWPSWALLLVLWMGLGAANAAIITPSGRLLRRSAHEEDRPAVFAAQFALSHGCWLVAYPMAGILGTMIGLGWIMLIMGALGLGAVALARAIWPKGTSDAIEHTHADLPPDHPHLKGATKRGEAWVHRHTFVIDDEHRVWPTSG